MTYRSLKKFINENKQSNNSKIFDLIPICIKSKIILVMGENASNTASFLTSIMRVCEISHVHYTNSDDISPIKRFVKNDTIISMDLICENAENIINTSKKNISNEDLFFSLALSFCDCEYAIIEISETYYNSIKNNISPFALIFTSNDDEKASEIIENAPNGVKEIISLSKKDNFDYVSHKYNANGAHLTLASPNKISISNSNLLGTSFYHYDYLYHICEIDLNNVYIAHLAIECASVLFSAPRPYIYKGLENARLKRNLILYSLSPAILLYEGNKDFNLYHKLRFKTVTEGDIFEIPNENTIFYGSKEYIEQVKEKLKKR
jgi:hypothetical protein